MIPKEKKLRILILEDNQDDRDLMERQLRKDGMSFVSECVDTRDEFTEAIKRFKPDVILSDHGLPQFNSSEALRIAIHEKVEAPFILVTGAVSEEFAISILKSGAHDYILKSNLSRLPTAVYRAIKERKQDLRRREAEDELKKQNEELIKANHELDHFVYSVSHNLRGPLASVMGLLTIANMEDRSNKLTNVHALMEASIHKLDETLKEIVDYSHNTRKDVKAEKINWEKLIDSSFKKLESLLGKTPITKLLDIQETNPFFSDPERLELVLDNLLSNGIIYRHKARELIIQLKITVTHDQVLVIITDNGIGIEEIAMPRIFEMFYRGTNRSIGAGLGLYIVKEIIAKLKGKISVTSVLGEGTTVTITLPAFTNGKKSEEPVGE